jgi:predicted enzyme related to lactoylglutathione lyase
MEFLVNVDVGDLDAASNFYVAAFGLEVGRRFGAFGVEMLGGPAPLYLLAKHAGTAAAATTAQKRSYARHWTPLHLDFVVEEIDSAVQKAIAAGAQLECPVTIQAWGKLALMADPFGHGFCFVQFLGRGYDEIADPAECPGRIEGKAKDPY